MRHCQVKILLGIRIWAVDKPSAVSFGAPLGACAMDWGRNRLLRVGKNCGPILSRLWAKVHEILGRLLFNVLVEPIMYIMFRSEDIRQ